MAVTPNPKQENPGVVQVAVSAKQYQHFTLDACGPGPMFSFASDSRGDSLLFVAN